MQLAVKKADKNEKRYFNMILQTKDESIKAVCFATKKQSELKTLEKVESPAKIQNFQKPDKDILLNKFAKIKPIEKSEIDFILVNMLYKSLLCNRQVDEYDEKNIETRRLLQENWNTTHHTVLKTFSID